MLESSVERRFVELCRRRGWKTYKLAGPGDRGKPDRLVLAQNVAVFVEIKRPGKEPTKLQNHEMICLMNQGFPAGWGDDAQDLFSWVELASTNPKMTIIAAKAAAEDRLREQMQSRRRSRR